MSNKKRKGLHPIRMPGTDFSLKRAHIPLKVKKRKYKKRSEGGRIMTGTEIVQILGGYE